MNLINYIRGKRKGKKAHGIEKDAMSDAFLHDALDGYDAVPEAGYAQIRRMQNKINQKSKNKKGGLWVYGSVAGLLLCLSVGLYFFNDKPQENVQAHTQQQQAYKKDTNKVVVEKPVYEKVITADSVKPENIETPKALPNAKVIETPAIIDSEVSQSIAYLDIEKIETNVIALESPRPLKSEDLPVIQNKEAAQSINIRGSSSTSEAEPLVIIDGVPGSLADVKNEDIKSVNVLKDALAMSLYGSRAASGVVVVETTKKKDKKPSTRATLKGTVTDTGGEPMPGVSVYQKGTGKAVLTDIDGKFIVDAATDSALLFTHLGYESVEINPEEGKQMNIAMAEDNQSLDEVVVIGYGVKASKSITGSISSISGGVSGIKTEVEDYDSRPVLGMKAYRKYLENEIVLPADKKCRGKVVLDFKVNSSGNPYDIKVKKGLCAEANNHAIKLVQNGCKWTKNSESVIITIKFKD